MSVKRLQGTLENFEIEGNYFELIEFTLVRQLNNGQRLVGRYGVNVAKVREVVYVPKINPLGSTVTGIAGIFELRGVPIPAVNLCRVLGDEKVEESPKQQIIVTEFSQKRAGFIVNSTNRIRRVAWEKVMPPSTDSSSCMTGMILVENNEFLFILDLERILAGIEGEGEVVEHEPPVIEPNNTYGGFSSPGLAPVAPNGYNIMVVDDSKLILQNLSRTLAHEGYRIVLAHDGAEALESLEHIASGHHPAFQRIDALVTDIEMPRLNGISLVTKLRTMPKYRKIPILLNTSLDGNASKDAAKRAGADGYVVKNDAYSIVEQLAKLLAQKELSVAN